MLFRVANRSLPPVSGPLLDATWGTLAGALLVAPFDPQFSFRAPLEAHAWLASLGLVSQVAGWLLIATALPRLPALETSILLLAQPVFAVVWGMLVFAERLSVVQWLGAALVLLGVGSLSWWSDRAPLERSRRRA
jgi:drug/metabolite transporter (DMT)-like permease